MNIDIATMLESVFPKERIRSRLIDRVAFSFDAGFYTLEPKAIVQPISEKEIGDLFRFSHEYNVPLMFRTAGTSLFGQAVTDGILVDVATYWKKIWVKEKENRVRVQPGITGALVNRQLKSSKRKIGPEPSSIDSAMMGVNESNNSSGICCGVKLNAYHTLQSMRFILPDGHIYSTGHKEDYGRFEKESPEIFLNLKDFRDQILQNNCLRDKIAAKYRIKNTVGYSLNAFLDFEHPVDILAHLLIGAEGTLAFISKAVLNTVPTNPFKATALFIFNYITDACGAISQFALSSADAIELMDRASLRSIEHIKDIPVQLAGLPPNVAALLVEYSADNAAALLEKLHAFETFSDTPSLIIPSRFTTNPAEQALLWKLKKGLFPAVGAVRARGTTVVLEDIAVPVERLGEVIVDLQKLSVESGYHDAIIFGYSKNRNIHFVIPQSFDSSTEVERYDYFIQHLVSMVVDNYGGSLKAEHGTGRNMVPFLETEWGPEACQIMTELKRVVDPYNILNSGVIINGDQNAHLRNLKSLPEIEHEVDKCIECCYCEFRCPSWNITLTPRQRIVVRREMIRSKNHKGRLNKLRDEFQYDGLDTCAVDGLCATTCPVNVNTGALVKRLRHESHTHRQEKTALFLAKRFGAMQRMVKSLLKTGEACNHVLGSRFMERPTRLISKLFNSFPLWNNQLIVSSRINPSIKNNDEKLPTVVYHPICISRLVGGLADRNKKNIVDSFFSVSAKSGVRVIIPSSINEICCSQLFSSRGYASAWRYMANKTVEWLWITTSEGKLPVDMDVSLYNFSLNQSGLTLTPENNKRLGKMLILDCIESLEEFVMPRASIVKTKQRIVLRPACSLYKMDLDHRFLKLAEMFGEKVDLPRESGCCGMAGDRRFLFPEFTASATEKEVEEVRQNDYDGYYSTAKTCEMALSQAVDKNYESILYLADECI